MVQAVMEIATESADSAVNKGGEGYRGTSKHIRLSNFSHLNETLVERSFPDGRRLQPVPWRMYAKSAGVTYRVRARVAQKKRPELNPGLIALDI
jgi:hypothetical protein